MGVSSTLLSLIQNIALILTLGFLYSVAVRVAQVRVFAAPLIYGLCFAVIAVLQTMLPLQLTDHVSLSVHFVVLAMATVITGTVSGALSAMFVTLAFMLVGAFTPALLIMNTGAVLWGLLFERFIVRKYRSHPPKPLTASTVRHVAARHYTILGVALGLTLSPWVWHWARYMLDIPPFSSPEFFIVPLVSVLFSVLGTLLVALVLSHGQLINDLSRSDQRIFEVINGIAQPVGVLNLADGTILHANMAFARDMKSTPEALRGQNGLSIFANRDDTWNIAQLMLKHGAVKDYEFEVVTPDGRKGWVLCSVQPVHFLNRAAVITSYFDITERKTQEQEFRTLVENSTDFILRLDTQLNRLYSNPAACNVLGFKPSKQALVLDEADVNAELIYHLKSYIPQVISSGKEVSFEIQLKSNAVVQFLEMRLIPEFANERVNTILCIARDMTERYRIIQEMLTSEQHYRELFNNVNDAILIFDSQDERIVDVNESACAMYGYTRKELMSMTLASIIKDTDAGKRRIKEILIKREMKNISTVHIRKDGTELNILVNAAVTMFGDKQMIITVNRDVTEIKRAEDALRQSESLYRLLAENTSDIVSHNTQNHLIYISPSVETILGWSQEEMHGIKRSDHYHPDELDYMNAMTGKLATATETITMEYRFRHKDGHYVWLEGRAKPILDEHGNSTAIVTVSRDITKRKQAEQELADQRALLEIILSQSADAIIVRGIDGKFVFVNAAARRLANLDPASQSLDLSPLSWGQAFTPEGQPIPMEERSSARSLKGETVVNRETHLVRADGREIDILSNSTPLRSAQGEIVGAVANIVDITERKQKERELFHNQQMYKSLVAHIPNGMVIVFDRDLRYLIVEGEELHNLGYDPVSFVGKTLYEKFNAEFVAFYEPLFKQTLAGDTTITEVNFAGHEYEAHFTPIRGKDGAITEAMGLFLNITDKKIAKSKEMELALEKARMRILSEFVSNVTHEFRTPLSSINANTYMLRRLADDPERVTHYVQRIEEQSANILELVDSLLVMTRLDADASFRRQNIDINMIVQSVADKLKNTIHTRNLSLTLDLCKYPFYVSGDPEYLGKAITHLLDNAVRYNEHEGQITISTKLVNNQVIIDVQDSGIGIEDAYRERIFERFFRIDQARSTRGFGLGLPIVRRIIEEHHGTIELMKMSEKGAHFRITLKAEKVPESAAR